MTTSQPAPDPSHPIDPRAVGPADPPPPGRFLRARLALGAVVLAVGCVGAGVVVAAGRADSALLFVGLPVVLALGVTLLARPRSGGGMAYSVVTVALLLLSALLREAAVCVLLAAPLVYLVTWLVVAGSRLPGDRSRYAVAPLLAVAALEGVTPGVRIHPEQTTTVSHRVAGSCAQMEARLAGSTIEAHAEPGLLLRLFPYPSPTAATGTGLAVGDAWSLTMPRGPLETRVSAADAHSVDFAVTADHSAATRWVDLRRGSIAWRSSGGGCETTLSVTWVRKLDPSWYFGPLDQAFVTASAQVFLAGLVGAP